MPFIITLPFIPRTTQPATCTASPSKPPHTSRGRLHPDTLSNHTLLKPHQQRTLLLQIRALHTINTANHTLTTTLNQPPSNKQLATYLGLSQPQLRQQTHAGIRARNDLVSANLRLVVRIATQLHKRLSRQTPQNIPLEDLVQEGCLALIKAAERYNMDSTARFSTFAYTVVYNACLREGPRGSIVTIPERLRHATRKSRNGLKIVAGGHADVPPHLMDMAEPHIKGALPLDAPLGTGHKTFVELVQGKNTPEEECQKELVRQEVRTACYRTLSERYADVLIMRFGLNASPPMSGKHIARILGVSEPRIAQIVLAALEKLRNLEPDLAHYIYDL